MAEPSRRAAVLGRPIAHSLSPVLHQAAYRALNLDWQYSAIDCGIAELPAMLADRGDWAGFSCTMPLKRAALEIADAVDPLATAVGAANTLLPHPGGGWSAHNTDVRGVVEAVRPEPDGTTPQSATVLGAGGTTQAVLVALAQLGVRAVSVLVRDPVRTDDVRATARRAGVEVTVDRLGAGAAQLSAELVVSTLPGAAADQVASFAWHAGQTVLDVVYEPWPTELARQAAARGANVRSGALMLLYQAAAQVELMTGQPAPVYEMRTALRAVRPRAGL